jgi:hypothetical protein
MPVKAILFIPNGRLALGSKAMNRINMITNSRIVRRKKSFL